MATTLPEVVFDGVPRKLACVPSPPSYSGLPKFGAVAVRELDPSEYVETDYSFSWCMDQGQHSSCVGHGWAGAVQCMRAMLGMTPADLSPSFLYSLINGNRDEGASISDGGVSAERTGFALMSEVPENEIFASQIPKSAYKTAERFRSGPTFHCQTYGQILSTLMLKGMVVLGFTAGNQTGNLDKYGVAPVIPGQPNHCVFAYGTERLPSGIWVPKCMQSWGRRFGDNGKFKLSPAHFPSVRAADACGFFTAQDDPNDRTNPPVAI
jgi:hypothetical protein